MNTMRYTLGIDIGSTTVKIAILDENFHIRFADYERHFANIQETLARLLEKAFGPDWEKSLLILTVKSLNRRIFWKVRAMPHWLISVVFLPVIFLPSRTILPVSGLYTPVSKLKIVVFPAPLGPIRP